MSQLELNMVALGETCHNTEPLLAEVNNDALPMSQLELDLLVDALEETPNTTELRTADFNSDVRGSGPPAMAQLELRVGALEETSNKTKLLIADLNRDSRGCGTAVQSQLEVRVGVLEESSRKTELLIAEVACQASERCKSLEDELSDLKFELQAEISELRDEMLGVSAAQLPMSRSRTSRAFTAARSSARSEKQIRVPEIELTSYYCSTFSTTPPVRQSSPAVEGSRRHTNQACSIVGSTSTELMQRPLRETLWEVALLTSALKLSYRQIGTIIFGILVNIVVQGTFSVVMMAMATEEMPKPEVMKKWRLLAAHDWSYKATGTGASLVSRVCSLDESLSVATRQMEILQTIVTYLHASTGLLLHICVLLVWCVIVVQELYATAEFMVLLGSLPRGSFTNLRVAANDSWRLEHVSIGLLIKMAALTILRAGLTCWLLIVGSRWLSSIKTLDVLVVNSVALSYVLHIDELLFSVLVDPPTKRQFASGACRQETQSSIWFRFFKWTVMGRGVRPVATAALCVVCVAGSLLWTVLPDQRSMQDLQMEACGGKQDFVFQVQPATREILYFNTTAIARQEEDNVLNKSIIPRAISDLINNHTSEKARGIATQVLFRAAGNEEMRNMALRWSECQDRFQAGKCRRPEEDLPKLWALRYLSNISDGEHCGDFRHACGRQELSLLRLLCPITCGCHDPGSGLLFSQPLFGCPERACKNTGQIPKSVRLRSCEDVSIGYLNASAHWHRMLNDLRDSGESLIPSEAEREETVKMLSSDGCNVARVAGGFCHQNLPALSYFCPVSCECDRVDFQHAHCPRACKKKKYVNSPRWTFEADLSKRECKDVIDPEKSNNMRKGWQQIVQELGESRWQLMFELQNKGCKAVASFSEQDRRAVCSGFDSPSIRVFCPEACGCAGANYSKPCPSSCKLQQS